MIIKDFTKLGFVVGKIIAVEHVLKSDKLLNFTVDIGNGNNRQIFSGVAKVYKLPGLIGKNVIVSTKTAPKIMAGLESNGMLIGIESDKKSTPRLIFLDNDLLVGTIIC